MENVTHPPIPIQVSNIATRERREGIARPRQRVFKYLRNVGIYGIVLTFALIAARGGFLFVEDNFDKFHTADVFKNEMTVLSTMPWNAVNALAASEKFRPQTSYMALCADRYACTREVVSTPDGRKKVTLVVRWRNSEGNDRTRRFFSFLGRNGLNG